MRVMTVEEQDGDRTVTTFERVDSQRRFAEPELRHIFESGEPLVGATGAPTAP
jgi:hypothetical protein